MKILGWFLVVWVIGWFVAATVDLWPPGQTRVFFEVRLASGPAPNEPEWMPAGATTYKIIGDNIVQGVGNSFTTYRDCNIYSLKNWECRDPEYSMSFGISDGRYWELHDKPRTGIIRSHPVSQFDYFVKECRRDAQTLGPFMILFCPFRPFFE